MKALHLALLQCRSLPGDVGGNLQRLDAACREAAASGTHLLITPEMFLTGYNIDASIATDLAQPPLGERVHAVAEMARRHRIAIVFGHPERNPDGTLANACVCVDASGNLLASYRKTHLFGDRERGMFKAGTGNEPPFELHGWKIGLLICYDVEFAENARRLALQHADLLVVPTANMVGYDFVPRHLVPTRAYENQLFVAYANFCGTEGDIAYNGFSCAAAPDGSVLATGGRRPSLVRAQLQPGMLIAERKRLGHLDRCREK